MGEGNYQTYTKNAQNDPRVPLNYRGVSLLPTVSKLFSGILNNRLVAFLDSENLIVDEQNGFRKSRACIDHIFVLTTIIRNRKAQGLSTFAAFVDMKKAFDWVNRDLLFYKLLNYGINGNFYNAIKNMYQNPFSCINVNGFLSPWFSTNSGVRQGDVLSPTLFSVYLNDLAVEINELHIGIPVGDRMISALLYADDIVIVADSEDKLQTAITVLAHWCQKWRMVVNETKTQIVHFRGPNIDRTNFVFQYNDKILDVVPRYKYLGVVLDEFLNFDVTAGTLSDAAGRALGAVISRIHKYRDFRFGTFTTLFNSCVTPITDYCSGIWGYVDNLKCVALQNRAIRYFLGVHKFAPKLAINGDMGWTPSNMRHKLNILRFWNRVVNMSNDRITKVVFLWDYNLRDRIKNWSYDIANVFRDINLQSKFSNLEIVNLDDAACKLRDIFERKWAIDVCRKPKLRTYITLRKNMKQKVMYCNRCQDQNAQSLHNLDLVFYL